MDRNGVISSSILSKFGLAIAVFLLLGSALVSYRATERTTQEEKLSRVLQVVSRTLRRADTLPGKARLVRDLPAVAGSYKLVIMESGERNRLVKAKIIGSENLCRSLLFMTDLKGQRFRTEAKNPRRIIVEKSGEISAEVI